MGVNIKDKFKNTISKVGSDIQTAVVKTKDFVVKKAPVVKDTIKKGTKKVVDVTVKTKDIVVSKVNDVVDDIKERHEERKEEIRIESLEKLKNALILMENKQAVNFIDSLEEPNKIIPKLKRNRITKTFPIPVEQEILWADVELDLRPSGIVLTDKGVFLKTNVNVFEEKLKKDEKGNKMQSNLIFCSWNNFDPSFFAKGELMDDIPDKYKKTFIDACNKTIIASSVVGGNISLGLDAKTVAYNSFVKNESRFGFLVEDYLTKMDNLKLKDAKIVGDNLKKSGPDRLVNNRYIQTKYHKSADSTLKAAFDKEGNYRYVDENNNAIQFEVPYDQFNEIKKAFKKMVKNGEVSNIKDEAQVDNIVKQGLLTHDQGVKLAKAGTIESIKYDALTGAVTCLSVFGLSFVTSVFFGFLATKDLKYAVKEGVICATKSYGLSILTYIATAQFLRTSLGNQMVRSTLLTQNMNVDTVRNLTKVTRLLGGKDAIADKAVKALRKELATTLNYTIISSAISFAVFSIPETFKLCTRKISGSQYAKNLVKLGASIVGGAAGSIAAGSIATAAGVTGSAGVAIGVAGSITGGLVVGVAVGVTVDVLCEDDVVRYSRLFNAYLSHYVNEYMLMESEIDSLLKEIGKVDSKQFKKFFEKLNASKNQEKTIGEFLIPYFENIVNKREKFALSDEQIIDLVYAQ